MARAKVVYVSEGLLLQQRVLSEVWGDPELDIYEDA